MIRLVNIALLVFITQLMLPPSYAKGDSDKIDDLLFVKPVQLRYLNIALLEMKKRNISIEGYKARLHRFKIHDSPAHYVVIFEDPKAPEFYFGLLPKGYLQTYEVSISESGEVLSAHWSR